MNHLTTEPLLLYIDATNNRKTTIKLGGSQIVKVYDNPRQQKILEIIAELLKRKKVRPEEISEIKVNPGPGSYTSLRVGCAVANAMSWALKIKVNGKKQITPVYD